MAADTNPNGPGREKGLHRGPKAGEMGLVISLACDG